MIRMLALSLLLLSGATSAKVDCAKAVSDPDINECASLEFDRVEAKLNSVYRKVLQDLKSEGAEFPDALDARAKLIEAQRHWIDFRQSDCDATYEYQKGGTIRTVLYLGCMTNHAELRIRQLKEHFQ